MRFLFLVLLTMVTLGFAQPTEVVVFHTVCHNSFVRDALDNLGWPYTAYDDTQEAAFRADVANGADIVVYNCPSNYEPASLPVLETYVDGGGKLIMSFWALGYELSSGLWPAMEMTYLSDYSTPLPFYSWEASHDVFNTPNVISFPLSFTDTWALDGQKLDAITDGLILGGYTASSQAGEGGMILGNDGNTIYNGFCIDEGVNIVPLIENELAYVWSTTALDRSTWGAIKTSF